MTSSTDLAAQLCSRLCHELLSPVGALGNGLELLSDERDPQMRQRCLDLLDQSARTSADKLRFFRLAYGAAGALDETMLVEEPKALIERLAGKRIVVNWALADARLPGAAVKVLLNLAAIGIEALPRGGTLDVGAELHQRACEIVVRAAGPRIAFDENIGRALDGGLEDGDLTGRSAPAQMIRLFAEELGGGMQHAVTDDALVLGAVLPR